MTKQTVHVFISYSHDSDNHVQNVVTLANSLRNDGVDAQLDRFVEAPAEGWPRWVDHQIADADFIVCVGSPQYRISFEGKNDKQKGLGVNQEGFLILSDLFEHGNSSERYIPVVFEGQNRGGIPRSLQSFQSYLLPAEYEKLFRRVTSQPYDQSDKPVWPVEPIPPAPRRHALANLPEKSEGFAGRGEITRFITPTQYPLERLAPRDGLYLSRIINPQQRTVHDVITTVWVTARGPLDYVIDSIRILDYPTMGLGGNPVVTLTPDAEYRFTYAEGSDQVHALNPALAVGPATRNRVSFTVGTAMEVGFYYVGSLLIWVQYHASDGRTGTLFLANVPADGLDLAKLAGADVEFPLEVRGGKDFGQLVITPEGVQRGFEPQHRPECRYVPFSPPVYPQYGPDRDGLLRARAKCQEALQQRETLSQTLRDDTKREELKKWLAQGSLLAADLLGGMADKESTSILHQEFRNSHSNTALTGLCIRHVAIGDELLADIARENEAVLSSTQLESILSALELRPVGAWIDLLLHHQKSAANTVRSILEEIEPELTLEDRSRILEAPNGPLGCELFVRGTMNNWTTPDSAKLVYQSDGNYIVTLSLGPGSYEFKIGSTDWRHGNFGGRDYVLRVTTSEQFELFSNPLSHNLHLDLDAAIGEYKFTVDARNFAKPLLRISRA